MTAKQQRFVHEYLIDLNATKAAIRAGYKSKNAEVIGYQLLQKTSVAEAVHQAIERRAARLNIKADRVLDEFCKIAFADRAGIAQVKRGRVIVTDTSKLTDEQKAALSEVSETQSGISVKLESKTEALKMIGKHLGMFVEKIEHSGNVKLTNQLSDEQLAAIAAGGGEGAAAPASSPKKST